MFREAAIRCIKLMTLFTMATGAASHVNTLNRLIPATIAQYISTHLLLVYIILVELNINIANVVIMSCPLLKLLGRQLLKKCSKLTFFSFLILNREICPSILPNGPVVKFSR